MCRHLPCSPRPIKLFKPFTCSQGLCIITLKKICASYLVARLYYTIMEAAPLLTGLSMTTLIFVLLVPRYHGPHWVFSARKGWLSLTSLSLRRRSSMCLPAGKRPEQNPGYAHQGIDNNSLFKASCGHVPGPGLSGL